MINVYKKTMTSLFSNKYKHLQDKKGHFDQEE